MAMSFPADLPGCPSFLQTALFPSAILASPPPTTPTATSRPWEPLLRFRRCCFNPALHKKSQFMNTLPGLPGAATGLVRTNGPISGAILYSPAASPISVKTGAEKSRKRTRDTIGLESSPGSEEGPFGGNEARKRQPGVKRACNECRQQKVGFPLKSKQPTAKPSITSSVVMLSKSQLTLLVHVASV